MQFASRCLSSRSHLHLSTPVKVASIGFKHHSSLLSLYSKGGFFFFFFFLEGTYTRTESNRAALLPLKEIKVKT